MQEFYLQNQDAIKFSSLFLSSRPQPRLFPLRFCRLRTQHSHIIEELPECILYLQFSSRNHYNIREQFSSIRFGSFSPLWTSRNCTRQSLAVHEFLMHFFTVVFPPCMLGCGDELKHFPFSSIYLIFPLYRSMSFESEFQAIIRIGFSRRFL